MSNDETKAVAITGGSGGLGSAMAVEFALDGYNVAINYRSDMSGATAAADTVRSHGREAVVVQGDVCTWAGVCAIVDSCIERWGRLDCLVNNAGGAYRWAGPSGTLLLDLDETAWDATVDLNLKAVFFGIKATAPHMIARGGGHILNIGSGAGLVGTPGRSAYSAAKAGVIGLTKAAARELGPHGIQINTVCPGLVLHERLREHQALSDEDLTKALSSKVLGRAGDAAEFARFVVMVAAMRNISGQTLNTDSRIV